MQNNKFDFDQNEKKTNQRKQNKPNLSFRAGLFGWKSFGQKKCQKKKCIVSKGIRSKKVSKSHFDHLHQNESYGQNAYFLFRQYDSFWGKRSNWIVYAVIDIL